MDKALFNFTQNLLRKFKQNGKVKAGANSRRLFNEYQFGQLDNKYLYFTQEQRDNLRSIILRTDRIDLLLPYPEKQTRENIAINQRNEKINAVPVSNDFVLVNSIGPLYLNGKCIEQHQINSLGQYLNAIEINSIEHKHIIMVENLCVMAALPRLVIPNELKQALWVYRGDIKAQQTSHSAYYFFRRWQQSHHLICFSDFDPKGIEIANSSQAHSWLAPEQTQWQNILSLPLQGIEKEWYKQELASKGLRTNNALATPLKKALNAMEKQKKTVKQEHMISHKIPLVEFKIRQ